MTRKKIPQKILNISEPTLKLNVVASREMGLPYLYIRVDWTSDGKHICEIFVIFWIRVHK